MLAAIRIYEKFVEHFGEEYRIDCSCSRSGCVMTPVNIGPALEVLEAAETKLGKDHPKVVGAAKGLLKSGYGETTLWRSDLIEHFELDLSSNG